MIDTVSFQQDTYHITLYLPKLPNLPAKNIRKLFSMMLSEPWNNKQAIADADAYFSAAVDDSKEAWAKASKEYQNGWRLIETPTRRRTRQEIKAAAAIRANNEALVRTVKKSKAQHESWVKIQTLWNDTKHKMKSI